MRTLPVDRVAKLGLTLSRAPEILRRQLALHRGEGLVVDAVESQSPAARVGIEPHDVLVQLDDQLLVLPEQLEILLEPISLPSPTKAAVAANPLSVMTILRAGQPLHIKLGGSVTAAPTAAKPALPVGRISTAATESEPAAKPAPAASEKTAPAPTTAPAQTAAKPPRPPRPSLRQPASAIRLAAGGEILGGTPGEDAVLLREDDDFTLRITQGDKVWLTVLTPDGKRVFDGRIDTKQRLAKVPPVLRPRVDAMLQVLGGQPLPAGLNQPLGIAPIEVSR